MKQKLLKVVRFLWDPICCAAGVMPFGYLMFGRFAPNLLMLGWTIPVLYGLMLMFALPAKANRAPFMTTLSMIVVMCASIPLLYLEPRLSVFVTVAGFAVMIPVRMVESGATIAPYLYGALHLICQTTILQRRITEDTLYEPIVPVVTTAFFVFLLMSMLSMNRENLQDISMGRHKVPKSMMKKQRTLTLAIFGGAYAITMIPAVVELIGRFFGWLLDTYLAFMAWLTSLLSGQESDDPPLDQAALGQLAGDGSKGGTKGGWEDIVVVLLVAVLTIIVIILLLKVLRKLLKALKRFWKKMGQRAQAETEVFEDEVTSTRDGLLKNWLDAWAARRKLTSVDEKTLSPGERIRYRYLRLMMKHKDWHSGKTARENLPDAAAGLYEQARYSDHPITEDDAQKFISGTKGV